MNSKADLIREMGLVTFDPVSCSMTEMDEKILQMENAGQEAQAAFYTGIKYHRLILTSKSVPDGVKPAKMH